MRKELEELNSDEKERQETELKAAKERRKAVEDLERGVWAYTQINKFHWRKKSKPQRNRLIYVNSGHLSYIDLE